MVEGPVPPENIGNRLQPRLPQRAFLTLIEKAPNSLALAGTECQTHFRSVEGWHHSKP